MGSFSEARFLEWLDKNATQGAISTEKIRSYFKKSEPKKYPRAVDKLMVFIGANSYKHKWEKIDEINQFIVITHYPKHTVNKMIGKSIKDTSGNQYMVKDVFFGVGYHLLLVEI